MVYIQLAYQGPEARDYLKTRLMEEKDIKPIEESDVPEIEILPQKALDFVGMRKYFSSVVSIGFVRADNLGENEIATLCQTFSSFSHSLLKYASRMPPIPLIGTKLGSFGLLCFVFEKGCDEDMIAFIQEQKHISIKSKSQAIFWVFDVKNGKVHPHKGVPLNFPIKKEYCEKILSCYRTQ